MSSSMEMLRSLDTIDDPEEDRTAPRFVMDFSMYRVAKQLRLLGFDVVCDKRLQQAHLTAVAKEQHRTLVSGSRFLLPQVERYNRELMKEKLRHRQGKPKEKRVIGYNSDGESEYETSSASCSDDEEAPIQIVQVQATDPHDVTMHRVMEVMHLSWDSKNVFTRCATCNRLIKAVDRDAVEGLVHPTVFKVYRTFYQCPQCKRVYWGVDNGVIVNYKALRTIEYLKRYAKHGTALPAQGGSSSVDDDGTGPSTGLTRHFLSYPRAVKCLVFDYLTPDELDQLVLAFPMLTELAGIVRRGEPRKFAPQWRMKNGPPGLALQ